ncbi:MAG: hypothetical protein GY796_23255 [Chloroflexi bacterium]|nr:hypothetical protein [Chloroflexota bacterium]
MNGVSGPRLRPGLFGNPFLAAGLGRLVHHDEVLVIQGDSFCVHGRVPHTHKAKRPSILICS